MEVDVEVHDGGSVVHQPKVFEVKRVPNQRSSEMIETYPVDCRRPKDSTIRIRTGG